MKKDQFYRRTTPLASSKDTRNLIYSKTDDVKLLEFLRVEAKKKKYLYDVKTVGEVYYVANTFSEFKQWLDSNIQKKASHE